VQNYLITAYDHQGGRSKPQAQIERWPQLYTKGCQGRI